MSIIRSVVYYGSKSRHLDFILPLLPMTPRYVEPFGGSAAVLLNRPRSEEEVYNDLYGDMVCLMRSIRDEPEELARLVSLTPHSRREYSRSAPAPDDGFLEVARKMLVRTRQVVSSNLRRADADALRCSLDPNRRPTCWRRSITSRSTPDAGSPMLASERLQGVTIENRDAVKVLMEYDSPDTLTYLDPPYVHEIRGGDRFVYVEELPDDGQRRLADALESIEGLAAVSGYESDLYEELYPASKGWVKYVDRARRLTTSKLGSVRTEVLWTNYEAMPL